MSLTRFSPSNSIFGIVAALTKDEVIGINGSLPWKNLPQDRERFVNLTRNRTLIMGRKTFTDEDPTGRHVRHARACIVMSRSLDAKSWSRLELRAGPTFLAHSFDDALRIANEHGNNDILKLKNSHEESIECTMSRETDLINCWIAGGESVYREALQNDGLREVHLTHVDMTIDRNVHESQYQNSIAYFPMSCFHQIGFEEVSKSVDGICTFIVYRKKLD